MADLFVVERLGETRCALVDSGRLVEMHIARPGDGAPAGSRHAARLVRKLGARGIAALPDGEEAVVEPWPAGASEGASMDIEITRQAWREPGRPRLAKARAARGPAARGATSTPAERLRALGHSRQKGWPDAVEAQWAEGFEAALLGQWALPTGLISFSPTAAFTAVDIDGTGASLPQDAAIALARAIRLWGLGGSIVADFPDCGGKVGRQGIAVAFDAAMQGFSFERTAINGFGLMQIVCPRPGPSVLERARLEQDANAAIALLALAQRETRPGALRLVAAPPVIGWLQARGALVEALQHGIGRKVDLAASPVAGSGHVETIPR